ncbi:unnamed protein product [Bursaphelenchus okinawaensis]|uniref:Uncharacterized protein n=1 Tax=Bursaphelenchus okinawaensis TaxID=465554 RepID=A0A811LM35_9BILA|nr:unnamed protein product [Bursaphelenchus okinawaensis]CAG9127890.1 unnamed protein product [Bursaphelenchus okinawaensis]
MNRDPDGLEQVNFLIERFAFDFQPYRKLDERWRWHDKEHVELNAVNGWLNKYDKVGYYACFLQLSNCSISEQCQSLLTEKGRISSNAVKQLLLIAGAKAKNCDKKLEKVLKFAPPGPKVTPSNLNDLTAELCTNLFDETSRIRKDKKKLASLEIGAVESLTEQMFVCTMFGFVEFVDINTIELILAWQHPRKGCYTSAKPDPMPKHGIIEPFDQFGDVLHESSRKQDACIDHQTAAAVNALAMVLKTLFDPPPWPDQRINLDNMLQQHLHQIPSEDRFHTFKYVNWVRDANLPDQYRLPRPPPNAWSPDLIAFVCLGFALLAISVCAHHIFSARNHPAGIGPPPKNLKQYYAYAYKKL